MSLQTLPSIGDWLAEIAALAEEERPARLKEMQAETRAAGGCGSMQTSNGLPCRRSPKVGYLVCRRHGERAPQTVAKAERLLAVARVPAIEGLLDILEQYQEETCQTCGYPSHSTKERKFISTIYFKLLDRTGFGPRSTIDLRATRGDEQDLDVSKLSEEEFQELGRLLDALDNFRARMQARQAAQVLASDPATLLLSAASIEPPDSSS